MDLHELVRMDQKLGVMAWNGSENESMEFHGFIKLLALKKKDWMRMIIMVITLTLYVNIRYIQCPINTMKKERNRDRKHCGIYSI